MKNYELVVATEKSILNGRNSRSEELLLKFPRERLIFGNMGRRGRVFCVISLNLICSLDYCSTWKDPCF